MVTNTPARAISSAIVAQRAILEIGDLLVERVDALADLLGNFVGVGMRLFQSLTLGDLGLEGGLLLRGRRDGFAPQTSQSSVMARRKRGRDDDPFPALGADRLGLALELLPGQAIEQRDILQPAAAIVGEEVVEDDSAGLRDRRPVPTKIARGSLARTEFCVSICRI